MRFILREGIWCKRINTLRRYVASPSSEAVRSGKRAPAAHADARYMALAAGALSVQFVFRLFPDGSGEGLGPDGVVHHRFRMWKEALRDAPPPA